jgi:hypothetical protein
MALIRLFVALVKSLTETANSISMGFWNRSASEQAKCAMQLQLMQTCLGSFGH